MAADIVDRNTLETRKKVPPDGGYAWIILLGNIVFHIALCPSFGLLYKDKIVELQLSARDVAIIQNVRESFGAMLGIFSGILIKRHGYRKVALVSAVLLAIGTVACVFVNNFVTFLIFYGLMSSIGFLYGIMAFIIATMSYFDVNRAKAAGLLTTIIGIGPIISPPLIYYTQQTFGSDGCMLIFAGVAMHTIAAALLLQPVEWHMKWVPTNEIGLLTHEAVYSFAIEEKSKRLTENAVNFETDEVVSSKSRIQIVIDWIVDNFDLRLFQSATVVLTIIGVAMTDFSELNFSMITPFILADLRYNPLEIASLMSIIGVLDIVTRIASPFIGDYFKQTPKTMFGIGSCLFLVGRIIIFFPSNYILAIAFCTIMGVGKGLHSVYWNVVIPNCVPIERLTSATAALLVSNGIFNMGIGPFVGILRDHTGNFTASVLMLSVSTSLTVIMWTIEYCYCGTRDKRREN